MMNKDTTDIVARVIKAGALRCNLWALGEVLSSYQENARFKKMMTLLQKFLNILQCMAGLRISAVW